MDSREDGSDRPAVDRQVRVVRSVLGTLGFTLVELIAAVAVLLVSALVIPAVIAVSVNHARIVQAQREVRELARSLQSCSRSVPAGFPEPFDLLATPGNAPISKVAGWTGGRTETFSRYVAARSAFCGGVLHDEPTSDPWGNYYVVNIGLLGAAPARRAIWVLSAGADGVIDTPIDQPAPTAVLHGDDVGVRVW